MTPIHDDQAARTAAFALALRRSFGARALLLARQQQLRSSGETRASWDRVVAHIEADGCGPDASGETLARR